MMQIPRENITEEQPKMPPVKKKNKICKILCTISAVFLLPIFFLVTALITDSGQRLFIQLADKLMDNLSIAKIDGGLQDGLVLKQISFQSQGIKTNIAQVNLQLDLHCLLRAKICLKDLRLNQAKIYIDTTQLAKSKNKNLHPMQKIKLPIEISVNNIEINQLALLLDQQQLQLKKFQTALTLNNSQGLTLLPTKINGLTVIHTKVANKQNDATANKSIPWEEIKQFLNRPLLAQLSEIELPFDLHIQGIQGEKWTYQQIDPLNMLQNDLRQVEISNVYLQADSTNAHLQLQKLQIYSSLGQLQGKGKMLLKGDFPLELQLQTEFKGIKHEGRLLFPPSSINLNLDGNLKKQTALSLKIDGLFEATLQARAEFSTPKTPFDIIFQIKKGQYPFEEKSVDPLKIQDVEFNAQGDLLNYQASLQGNAIGMGMPKTQLAFALEGELTQFTLQRFRVNALNMEANAKANVNWQEKLKLKSYIALKGKNVQLRNMQVNKIDLLVDIRLEDILQGQLTLDVNGFRLNDIKLNSAQVQIRGTEREHKMIIKSQGTPVSLALNLIGKFDRSLQLWQGVLNQANVQSSITSLMNSEKIQLSYDNLNKLVQVSAHCWQAPNLHFCFPQAFTVGKVGDVSFEFKTIDLALLNKLIAQESVKGKLSGQGRLAWFHDKLPYISLQFKGNNLHFAQKLDYRTFHLTVPTLNINTELKNNNLNLSSNFNLQNKGKINTELKVLDVTNQKILSGYVKIKDINLNIANQLLSNGEKIDGHVNANLRLDGNLNNPLLNGEFSVKHIYTKMKAMPFDITNGNVVLHFYGNNSTLKGNIRTNESRLNIEGQANWQKLDNWQARLRINANKFKVDIPSIAKLQLSPNIEINAMPKLLNLNGNIDIPWARIVIENLPESAVALSKDEIILDGPHKTKERKLTKGEIAATTKNGMQIRSNLKIKVGDDVRLSAYGLKTGLNGLLSVQQEEDKIGLFGQINLQNGRYESFGQNLLIRKGIVSFSGVASQPMLNIEAIRNPSSMENTNIIAGVKVIGVADSPEITVFSEPATSKVQALSYLLTGRSLERSGENGSSGSIGATLLGIGLAKSGKLIGGIGEMFGIKDLNLGTSNVGDGSTVVVSGNITPKLQIKYGVGLFDGVAEFTLRYRLLPKLYLQSVSSITQTVDLLYQFEF